MFGVFTAKTFGTTPAGMSGATGVPGKTRWMTPLVS